MGSFLRIDVLTGSKKLPVQATIGNFAARSRSIYFLHARFIPVRQLPRHYLLRRHCRGGNLKSAISRLLTNNSGTSEHHAYDRADFIPQQTSEPFLCRIVVLLAMQAKRSTNGGRPMGSGRVIRPSDGPKVLASATESRLAQSDSFGRTTHMPFVEQGFEREQEVEVEAVDIHPNRIPGASIIHAVNNRPTKYR